MGYGSSQLSGSWWNPFSWGDGGGPVVRPGGTLPPGEYPKGTAIVTQEELDLDDLDIIRQWSEDVKWGGGAPTRVPAGRANGGKLAFRVKGPGTAFPDAKPPFDYYLAPASVLAADARLANKYQDAKDELAPRSNDDPSLEDKITKYGMVAGGLVLAAIFLPPLLRRPNPRGRRRRRR